MLQMNMNTVSERELRGPMPRHAANIPVRVQIERSAIVGAQGTRRKAVSLQDKRVYIVSRIPAFIFLPAYIFFRSHYQDVLPVAHKWTPGK